MILTNLIWDSNRLLLLNFFVKLSSKRLVISYIFAIATLFLVLPIAIPGIAVTARRIHDFGKSGWMQCIFIPGFVIDEYLGTGYVIWLVTFIIFAIYCSQSGTNGKNKFGSKPRK